VREKLAVIDLGTNTFNLLIASKNAGGFDIIHSEKVGVALGMGGINDCLVSPDAFERGIKALVYFKEKCDALHVDRIAAIGTSALRDAENQAEFLSRAKSETGIDIEIISGDREAELIYKGVKWSFDFREPTMIMDIGGGSTELILADAGGLVEKQSFNIGVSRIYQEFDFSDPYTEEDIVRVREWLEEKTEGFFKGMVCRALIGASGSFETFYEMIHHEEFPESRQALEFPVQDLRRILKWIIGSTQQQRDEHPYIIPIRRKMAPIAAIKTGWVMDKLHVEQTFVTPFSLKEGVLYERFVEGL
jgi:exopolyphosphatase/guanosine-5'-triphosphate,3'-diphosphate pyrophosphatase